MKNYLTLIAFILLTNLIHGQPPSDPINPVRTADTDAPPKANCLEVSINSSNGGVINLDCPENSFFWAKVERNDCGCETFILNINGIPVRTLTKAQLALFTLNKDQLKGLINGDKTGVSSFTIRLDCVSYPNGPITSIATTSGFSSITVNVVKVGIEYEKEISVSKNEIIGEYIPAPGSDETTICCNEFQSKKIVKSSAIVSGETIQSTWNIEFSGEILDEPFTIKSPISYSIQNIKFETNQNLKFSEDIFEMHGRANTCLKVGFQVVGDIVRYQKYIAKCNGSDEAIGSVSIVAIPTSLVHKGYEVAPDPASSCKPIRPIVEVRRTLLNRLACTGSLILNLDPSEEYYIGWVDADGNNLNHYNGTLTDVPVGQYTVTISNNCCDVVTKTYYVCGETNYSPYTKNNDGTWCRTVTCSKDGCAEVYTECVTPDAVDESFNIFTKKCVKTYFYQGIKIGEEMVDATHDTEYNEIFERCETTYFCKGSEVFVEEYQPEETEWEYDDFFEECRLNVSCQGNTFTNVSQTDPEIEWEWDEFFEECVSTYLACDGYEIDDEITSDAYNVGNWSFGSGGSICVRDIICVQGGTTFRQEIDATFEPVGVSSDCDDNSWIKYNILCDGTVVDFVCAAPLQNPQPQTRTIQKNKLVNISVYNDQVSIKIKSDNQNHHYSLMIFDLMGRVYTTKEISNTANNISLKLDGINTGMYIASVIQDGYILHSQKIIINN